MKRYATSLRPTPKERPDILELRVVDLAEKVDKWIGLVSKGYLRLNERIKKLEDK